MKDCTRCGGKGWLPWFTDPDDPKHWTWPSDAVIGARVDEGVEWHPEGRTDGYCPICPCTVEGRVTGGWGGTMEDKQAMGQLALYQCGRKSLEDLAQETGFSVAQLQIRFSWMAHHLELTLRDTECYELDIGNYDGGAWCVFKGL